MLRLTDVIIDCPDAMALAGFYAAVTGLPVKEGSTEHWAGLQAGEVELAFTPVEDYRAPRWPESEHPKQFHLDFEVDDIEAEHARVVGLGAELKQDHVEADGYGFRVYVDPVGHPFCLCRNQGVSWVDGRPVWPAPGETQA
ncbi:VOC family protein [Nocardioides sp. zg-579]|uniref:VOC family protein n=1 Tax=Nocardioides marmotae TaxID=2663857 RepID=A0A6I3JCF0_9ACTN|nr:VOC family protein [Nocardioides marmotae]MCR6032078.1 VOC family protein [Gordonia jinghuaiqii]MTB95723.1 VOC family protein [Nocardioides marmotae]QKE01124.1 VOC family protein [Nocardioides marmotae]